MTTSIVTEGETAANKGRDCPIVLDLAKKKTAIVQPSLFFPNCPPARERAFASAVPWDVCHRNGELLPSLSGYTYPYCSVSTAVCSGAVE